MILTNREYPLIPDPDSGLSPQRYDMPVIKKPLTGILSEVSKRAEDGTQTRDPQLGRLMLYRLSYFRMTAN